MSLTLLFLKFDDAVFVPPADSPSDYQDIDDNSIDGYPADHNVDVDVDTDGDDDQNLKKEVEVENVVIIVLATLLFSLLFFAGLIFYYVRGKTYLRDFAAGHKWSKDFR